MANATGLDLDETLLALWGGGIYYPDAPSSRIRSGDVRAAEAVTGFFGDQRSRLKYWQELLDLSRPELAALLHELGFDLHERAKTLPKGAIKKLAGHTQGLVSSPVKSSREPQPALVLPVAPPFRWSCIGSTKAVSWVTAEEVRIIHHELEKDFAASDDPISPPGVKSDSLLESAVARQNAGYGHERKSTTVVSTAAALLHSLVQNHVFYNGNKRTALVSMLVMLDKNGMVLSSNQDELFRWMLRVAGHDLLPPGFEYDNQADRETFAISEWINRRSRAIRRDEKGVTWLALARILKKFNCEVSRRGERMDIARTVEVRRKSLLKSVKLETLRSTYVNTGDGREVPRKQLKRIREELRLDEAHGVDAEAFFDSNREIDDFIAEYSKLLRRLARV
ncbi:type II toxin-antitoxin system death-on-curing family toxin [Salinibacterium sp. G-O1]|uniref:type II toxin-antitoxin system death-on-curing family toxin n=1 Tax=Salinibacterium sp. G-O1 TaxID=3046208 RepID=UPI0024BAD296|nr:type II toxin-antitoxin system death-on-curing family toxin [Salinibacterium sp. G-O1]MDJ0333929.1 type II toxin-antitoxin system death-on-curing family toxin [Salinibacterium sp. G-O1]